MLLRVGLGLLHQFYKFPGGTTQGLLSSYYDTERTVKILVREMENVIEHAFILSPGGAIKPEHLPDYLQEKKAIPVIEIASTMNEMESLFIIAALKRNNWSRKKTSEELGINTSTLYRKIKKLGLKIPE